jgi:hypothetical protein
MATPPDRPTEPLHPRAPLAREEVVAAPAVDPAWPARLDDRLRSLRNLLALVSVLALAALGLAAWALLRDDDTEAGPSNSRVARISDKLDRLEQRLGGASEESDTTQLQEGLTGKADAADLARLQREVRQLRASVAEAGDAGAAEAPADDGAGEAVTALDTRVDELEQQVGELQADAGQGGQP